MKLRTIYKLEAYDDNFNLIFRLYYRNRRAAERARRQFGKCMCYVTLVPKCDHVFIDPDDVRS